MRFCFLKYIINCLLYWVCQSADNIPSLHCGTEWSLGGLCWADGQSLQPACLPVFHYTSSPRDSSSSHSTAQNWTSLSHCHYYFLTRKTTIVSDICTVQLATNLAAPLALDVCAESHDEFLCNAFICWGKKYLVLAYVTRIGDESLTSLLFLCERIL